MSDKKRKDSKKQEAEDQKKNEQYSPPLTRKTSKSKLPEEYEVLDLSLKKKRTSQIEAVAAAVSARGNDMAKWKRIENIKEYIEIPKKVLCEYPWGCIQFYEGKKPVFIQELSGDEPIEINVDTIIYAKPPQSDYEEPHPNPNMTYNDWMHVIGNGFSLKRTSIAEFSSIEMQSLDRPGEIRNKYKIFVDDKQIPIADDDIYEVYNGKKILERKLKDVKDMKTAYELANSCHFIIAVFGKFMQSTLLPITFQSVCRQMIPSYSYWFYVKIYPEFALLDREAANLILFQKRDGEISERI